MPKISIKLTEPTFARYIYLDSNNNRLHLMLPIVSGSAGIGLDNTCEAVSAVQEFFGKKLGGQGQSALDSLKNYQQALEFDIGYLEEYPDLKKQKEGRLEQVKFYISVLKVIHAHDLLEGLNGLIPQYPSPLQQLMKQKNSNFHSMVLRPRLQDYYLRTVNPTFSLPHGTRVDEEFVHLNSDFYNRTLAVFETIDLKATDKRAKLIEAVLASQAGVPNNFAALQQALGIEVKNRLGETIDFTQKSKADLDAIMGFDHTSTAQEYIEALLGFCAPLLFEMQNQSPFNTIDPGTTYESKRNAYDKLSILTQFFLAEANIYCVINQKTTENFGMVLEKEGQLSLELAGRVKSCLVNDTNVEDSLLDCIISHEKTFGLTVSLTEEDQQKIKKQFYLHYAQIKDSPHFDEFMIVDIEKPGLFVSHQGAICTHFAEFIQAAITEDPSLSNWNGFYLKRIRDDFKNINGQLGHQNSLYTDEEETIQITVDFAELPKRTLNWLLGELPHKEKARIYKQAPEVFRLAMTSLAPNFLSGAAMGVLNQMELSFNRLPETGRQILLQTNCPFTDFSGRTFNCSAFEYAYWAKDTSTLRILMKYMDEETKLEMALRISEIEQEGLSYTINGEEFRSSHFDFTLLKKAYTHYIWLAKNNASGTVLEDAWLYIGKAQKFLPVHVIKEYCHPSRAFYPCPSFNEETLSSNFEFFDIHLTHRFSMSTLWVRGIGLGSSRTLFRGISDTCSAGSLPVVLANLETTCSNPIGATVNHSTDDLTAIKHLDTVRSAELMAIRAELREAITNPTSGCTLQ